MSRSAPIGIAELLDLMFAQSEKNSNRRCRCYKLMMMVRLAATGRAARKIYTNNNNKKKSNYQAHRQVLIMKDKNKKKIEEREQNVNGKFTHE